MSRFGKISLVFAGLVLVFLVLARAFFNEILNLHYVLLSILGVCLLLNIFFERRLYWDFMTTKTTKQGMSLGVTILVIVVGVVALNIIGAKLNKTFDFSLSRKNSLSEQSVNVVKQLNSTLKVIYFYKQGAVGVEEARRGFSELIKLYQDHSRDIDLQFVEVNSRPDLSEKYEIRQGTQVVIVDYKGRTSRIEKIDEQELTSAIVKVFREKEKTIYFVSGHGELSLEAQPDGQSLSYLKEMFERNRYKVAALNLREQTSVPSDADIVMIAGPKAAFLDLEIRAIEDYLAKGGALFIGLDAEVNTGLESLLQKIGIKNLNQVIALRMRSPLGEIMINPGVPGEKFPSQSAITKPFGQDQFALFFFPQPLEKLDAPGVVVEELIKTNPNWVTYQNRQSDKALAKGPFTVGMTAKGRLPGASAEAKEFIAVVFGDSEFLNDQLIRQNLNRDLVLNSAAFLSREENLVSISPREVGVSEVANKDGLWRWLMYGVAIPLPLILFIFTGVLWHRRVYS